LHRSFNLHPSFYSTVIDVWVRADALRLQQVLNNLVSNAVRYSRGDTTNVVDIGVSVMPWHAAMQQARDSLASDVLREQVNGTTKRLVTFCNV
jgi:C4-dicarboxylate-specific signal transduction histidine kinase